MPEAVIVSAVCARRSARRRTAPCAFMRPDDMAATVIADAAARAGARPARDRRRDDRLRDAGGRTGPQRRAHRQPARRDAGAAPRRSRSTASARRDCRRSRFAAERIRGGSARAIIAGGTESMSLVPMGGNKVSPNPALVGSLSGRVPDDGPGRREPRARVRASSREEQDALRAARAIGRAARSTRTLRRRDRSLEGSSVAGMPRPRGGAGAAAGGNGRHAAGRRRTAPPMTARRLRRTRAHGAIRRSRRWRN